MTTGIEKVNSTTSATMIYAHILECTRPAAVWDTLFLNAAEYLIEFFVSDFESIVVSLKV